jgi:hypothetical protein
VTNKTSCDLTISSQPKSYCRWHPQSQSIPCSSVPSSFDMSRWW